MKKLTPIKAIRAKCLDCTCGSSEEIKQCPITGCSLYPYRFGKNPHDKRKYTEEQLSAMRDRLKHARLVKNLNKISVINP